MKAMLRATTILAGAVVLAHGAMAQTAGPKAPFEARLDGEAQGYLGFQSGQRNNGSNNFPALGTTVTSHGRSYGLVNNAEAKFTFRATADNGLTYGFYVRFPLTSDNVTNLGFAIDREKLFIQNLDTWGQFAIGNDAGTSKDGFPYTDPLWGQFQVNGLGPDQGSEQLFMSDPNAQALDGLLVHLGADNQFGTGRANHLLYKTRSFYLGNQYGVDGLTFAIDYAPDGQSRAEDVFNVATTGAGAITISSKSGNRLQNIIGVDVQDQWAMNDLVSGAIGANFAYAQPKDVGFGVASSTQVMSFTTGASVQVGTWRGAVGLTYAGKSAVAPGLVAAPAGVPNVSNKETSWGYTLMLEQTSASIYQPDAAHNNRGGIPTSRMTGGDWSWGPYYQYARAPGPFGDNGIVEINYFGLGGAYWLATGLYLFAEGFYYNDWNTHAFVAGSAARFQLGTAANARNPQGQIYIVGTSIDW